jgi:hypothetical protein
MNFEVASALGIGLVVGVAFGWWRCFVYCRKLRHFGIDLDDWSHYDATVEQAKQEKSRREARRLDFTNGG